MAADVESSYSSRAAEYAERLGSMSAVHPSDEQLVTAWAASVDGPLLDAGCGPGHWTAHLSARGVDALGVDRVPEFIQHARKTHPAVPFTIGDLDGLTDSDGTFGGVLSWYSLIHHKPSTIRRPLGEFARVLRPGGQLLVGFFLGTTVEPFEHAVVRAYTWPAEALEDEVRAAGFDVIETHTRTVARPRPRPHGAILASRR